MTNALRMKLIDEILDDPTLSARLERCKSTREVEDFLEAYAKLRNRKKRRRR